MQLSYLLLFSLVALAANSGSTFAATTCMPKVFPVTYDDLPQQPPASVPLPFGPYNGLAYNNFALLTLGILGSPPPTGVKPSSNPNVVANGLFAASSASKSNATVGGGGGGYKLFIPIKIAYGCVVATGETITGVPASCTLAFTGYKAGTEVKRQLVTYEVANGEVSKAMSAVRFESFGRVDTVRFEVTTPTQLVVAFLLDDFTYSLCT